MKTRGMIFTGDSVNAILDGRKTMTRRVIKPQPCGDDPYVVWDEKNQVAMERGPAPFVVGMTLWVRETWMAVEELNEYEPVVERYGIIYRADPGGPGKRPLFENHRAIDYFTGMDRWRPSIFMPRWASRISLEVKAVRVERVQEITAEECLAEGICGIGKTVDDWSSGTPLPDEVLDEDATVKAFADLWDSINGKKPGCSWADNPFVWCVSFERRGP